MNACLLRIPSISTADCCPDDHELCLASQSPGILPFFFVNCAPATGLTSLHVCVMKGLDVFIVYHKSLCETPTKLERLPDIIFKKIKLVEN